MSGQEPSPLWLPRCGICGRITDTRAIDPAAIREAALRDAADAAVDSDQCDYPLVVPEPWRSAILAMIDNPEPDHSAGAGNMIDKGAG